MAIQIQTPEGRAKRQARSLEAAPFDAAMFPRLANASGVAFVSEINKATTVAELKQVLISMAFLINRLEKEGKG